MMQLDLYRQEIIELDKQIARLLEERFEFVMKNATDSLKNDTYKKEIEKVFQNIIIISKSIQY